MINWKEITIEDKGWVDELLSYSDYMSLEYSFTVMYIWRRSFQTKIGRYKDLLLVRSKPEAMGYNNFQYIYPAGRGSLQDIKDVIEFYREDALQNGEEFNLVSVSNAQKEILEGIFPDKFSYTPTRDTFDYIYSAESMVFLRGKKMQSKRNFISRFKRQEGWIYEEITPLNVDECLQMNEKWCAQYGCGAGKALEGSLQTEYCSVRSALHNFTPLGLKGGLLRLNGEVVAFTVGEQMNSNTFLVHIEKAFADIVGAYPTISNEFLRNNIVANDGESLTVRYINREDDAGDLGLREAKMQYNPLFLFEKYSVKEK